MAIHSALDPRAAGGVQTNLLALVRGLSEARDPPQVTLLSPPAIEEPWRVTAPPSFAVRSWPHIFPWYPTGDRSLQARLRDGARVLTGTRRRQRDAELRQDGIGVVHFPYQLAFDTALPSVYEPWDLQHVQLPHLFTSGERRWRTEMYSRSCRRATLVVTATQTTKADLVAEFGLDPQRVAVIYRESHLADAPPPHERRRLLTRLGVEAPFALFPGMTYPHKNHLRLIDALAALRDRGTVIPLVLSGRHHPVHHREVEKATAERGLLDQVRSVGAVDQTELAALYAEARMLVFPSLFEGLGLPLLEAMQSGLPIAAARASCLPEVVDDAAVLFDPYDPAAIAEAIELLWHDDHLRSVLAERGRRRRLAFSWETAAATFVAAYAFAAGRPMTVQQEAHIRTAVGA